MLVAASISSGNCCSNLVVSVPLPHKHFPSTEKRKGKKPEVPNVKGKKKQKCISKLICSSYLLNESFFPSSRSKQLEKSETDNCYQLIK